MTTIIIFTLFLASVIAFGLLMKNFRTQGLRTRKNPIQPPPVKPEKSPEEEYKEILDSLLKTNIMIRKDKDFSKEMLARIEFIIDDLKAVIPNMMAVYPGETLTYEIKKIGKNHLNKTVKEFLDLSSESREAQGEIFKATVNHLQEVVHRSREIVENNETAEFKTMAQFLGHKFS